MKNYISVIIYSITISFCIAQQNATDSIRNLLKEPNLNDNIRIDSYIDLANELLAVNIDSFGHYADRALKLSKKNNDYQLPRIYNSIGLYHIYKSQQDSAHHYFDKALNILDSEDNKLTRAFVYANYSMSYQNSNDFQKQIDYNLMAIELLWDNPLEVARLHYNQAIILGNVNFADKSKSHLRLALANSKKSGNKRIQALSLKGLAHWAIEEKKLDSATVYLNKGVELCEETQNPQICYETYSKMGELYSNDKNYKKANNALLKAKEYALKRNFEYNIMSSYVFLGQHELKWGNYKRAASYFTTFDSIYEKNPEYTLGVLAYKDWSNAEAQLGNYKESNSLLRKHLQIRDSIYKEENRMLLAEADAKYQSEKKDKELAEQNLKIEKQQAQNKLMTALATAFLLTSILVWYLYQQRQKRKNQEILTLRREQQVKTLESLMQGEEKERLRIAKELHDGVNGDLSAIKYKLTSILEHNTTVVNEVVQMLDRSSEQVRAISHNLVPPALEKFNLIEALEDYAATMNDIHEPEITFQFLGEPLELSKNIEVNLYRIVQELVNNAVKHAQADEITIQISHQQHTLLLTVEDNGKGFDPRKIKSKGIGLQNIESRIDYLKGKKDLISNEKGTTYSIEIDTRASNTE